MDEAIRMEAELENNTPLVQEQPSNNSMYIYATAIILPLILATITILGIPVNKESKTGVYLKIFAIILIVFAIIGMYMYHKQIDIIAMFKSQKN